MALRDEFRHPVRVQFELDRLISPAADYIVAVDHPKIALIYTLIRLIEEVGELNEAAEHFLVQMRLNPNPDLEKRLLQPPVVAVDTHDGQDTVEEHRPMTDAEVADIDGTLEAQGWHYHAGSETFLDGDDNVIDWSDVPAALPDLSINELEAYRDRKVRHLSGS